MDADLIGSVQRSHVEIESLGDSVVCHNHRAERNSVGSQSDHLETFWVIGIGYFVVKIADLVPVQLEFG